MAPKVTGSSPVGHPNSLIRERNTIAWQPPAVASRASLTRTFTHDDVETFAVLSGDRNPLHFDASFAASTRAGPSSSRVA